MTPKNPPSHARFFSGDNTGGPSYFTRFFRDANKADALAKVGRYVREAESSFRTNLSLLERAQARRRGEVVPLPATLDVTVTADTGQPK